MNITPLKRKLIRLVKRSRNTFRDLSSRQWTICPAEQRSAPPAIYLDGDLDKVTALMEDTTHDEEMRRIRGGPSEHGATVAYSIADCELLDGNLYKGTLRLPLSKRPERLIGPDVTTSIPAAALTGTFYGSFYFGHWMTDDLTLELLAEPIAPPVTPARKPYGHEPGYCDLLGIQPNRMARVRFDDLIVFDDIGQNSHKQARYEQIRSRLAAAWAAAPHERVYVRRGQQGSARALTNAQEIEETLVGAGFRIVDPEQSTVPEIVAGIGGARLVVGLEGSHITHAIYSMAQGGGLCILQPPFRFNNVHKNYTDCLGMQYGFVTGRATTGGFAIDPGELLRVLERIDAACSS